MYMYLPNPYYQDMMWHKVLFYPENNGLNSKLSFSLAGSYNKAKEPSLPFYLPITGGGMRWILAFPKGIVRD